MVVARMAVVTLTFFAGIAAARGNFLTSAVLVVLAGLAYLWRDS